MGVSEHMLTSTLLPTRVWVVGDGMVKQLVSAHQVKLGHKLFVPTLALNYPHPLAHFP